MSILALWTALRSFLGPILKALLDWRVLLALAVLALLWGVYSAGKSVGAAGARAEWDNAELQRSLDALATVGREARIAAEIGRQAAERENEVNAHVVTLIERIPVVITREVDGRYPLPCGLVRLHDGAALGVPPGAVAACAGRPDDAAAPVKASYLAATLAGNYGICAKALDRANIQWPRLWREIEARRAPPG